ncbi:MAG: branched-chain amino acid aminotransferase [Bacteroidia bacterium]|nr:branched-chain amino acid aminotransferase [Bacteroidia bacterium]
MASYPIKINKTSNSRLDSIDFNNIPFGTIYSDHMFVADYIDGEWTNLEIAPFGPITMNPSNLTLHYGQSIFEGMKAFKDKDHQPLLFRPEMHAYRLNASAVRLCMPQLPTGLFDQALRTLVELDSGWIPETEGSALYVRPFMFATDDFIGVKPSDTYKFIIFTCPVGPYYNHPVTLRVEEKYVRAADGGVGEAKCAGNYAASLFPTKLANKAGFDQVMWMDSKEFKYIEEVGTMNLFFVIDGVVITPATGGSILKGITRDSIITILKDKGYRVEERPISIDEVVDAYKGGKLDEAFGSGTAAVVADIKSITYGDFEMIMRDPADLEVANLARNEIKGIRDRTIDDKFGWVHLLEGASVA